VLSLDKVPLEGGGSDPRISGSLTAEDVTTQLVDGEARLRNLRRQESILQKIMDRSGSIPGVQHSLEN